MPEVTVGFSGSNGMPFLLQVMPARSSALLGVAAGQPQRPQIDQHQMRVGAAGDDRQPALGERRGQRLGVLDDGARVRL